MLPAQADFIDLPSSVLDAKYGKVRTYDSVVVTTYTGSEFDLAPMLDDKIYRVRGLVDYSSSAVSLDECVTNFMDNSTWKEIHDSIDDLHVDLIPVKKFKMKMKISKVNKPTPKFFLD